MIINDEKIKFFRDNGWLIIKNVFPKEEITAIREKIERSGNEKIKGDLLSNPFLNNYVYDSRLIEATKGLLGTEHPVYFGDSSYSIGFGGGIGFHKDNPDKFNGNGPDWKTPYTIIRMGIYTQDHKNYSGCLALRDKSHNTVSITMGKPFLAPTEPGDLVIWTLRTSHSGYGKRLKIAPDFFVPLRLYKYIPEFFFKPEEKERYVLFLTYAKESDNHLQRYVRYLKNRRYMMEIWQNSVYKQEIKARAKGSGLEIVDIYPEVRNVDLAKVNVQHIEMEE